MTEETFLNTNNKLHVFDYLHESIIADAIRYNEFGEKPNNRLIIREDMAEGTLGMFETTAPTHSSIPTVGSSPAR